MRGEDASGWKFAREKGRNDSFLSILKIVCRHQFVGSSSFPITRAIRRRDTHTFSVRNYSLLLGARSAVSRNGNEQEVPGRQSIFYTKKNFFNRARARATTPSFRAASQMSEGAEQRRNETLICGYGNDVMSRVSDGR